MGSEAESGEARPGIFGWRKPVVMFGGVQLVQMLHIYIFIDILGTKPPGCVSTPGTLQLAFSNSSTVWKTQFYLVGGFNCFLFSPRNLGKMNPI